jgi:hypothetical protein
MSRRTTALALSLLAVLWSCDRLAVGGELSTPLQTQSIPMTATDWGPGTGGITNPMAFSQFNPKLGTLDAVVLTLNSTITNDFELIFVKTPIPTTLYVATTETSNPSVLANAGAVAQLTDGPSITLNGPGGTTLFGGPATTVPVDVVTRTEVSGTWSSYLPDTNPNYIAPSSVQLSLSRTLDAANAASLLPDFIGTGKIDLPISANAYSSFYSDSGNGGGVVRTSASATVTLQYWYTAFGPQSIPEPSSFVLLGLGTGLVALAARRRGRS